MTTTDYTQLDKKIVAAVAAGAVNFHDILRKLEAEVTAAIPEAKRKTDENAVWRLLDRRLQALRKSGSLTSNRIAGWRVAAPKP